MSYLPIRSFTMPEVYYGPGSRSLAGEQLSRLRVTHVLLVTDEKVHVQPWVREIEASVRDAGVEMTLFSRISPNPRDTEVRKGTAVYLKAGCDGILAVGGGSPMDAAKGIGIMVSNSRDILEFGGWILWKSRLPPMVFVPSTAGTASEVSQFLHCPGHP